jgi:hypothetical protein
MDMLYDFASAITHEVKFKASVDVFSKMCIQKGAIENIWKHIITARSCLVHCREYDQ